MNWLNTPGAVILIVDPDPLMLTGIAAVLDSQGYECHCARDAEAARRAASTLPLDLIVCEMDMPGQSGMELCRELMESADIQAVPVIYLCSEQQITALSDPLRQTFVLRRPFEPQALIDEVANALWMPHLVNTRVRQKLGQECPTHIQNASVIPAPAATRRTSTSEARRRS